VTIPVLFDEGPVFASPLLSCAGYDCGIMENPPAGAFSAGFR